MDTALAQSVSERPRWVELAKRATDGLEVALLWNRSSNRVKVAVSDERLCHYLDFEVAPADALSAFTTRSRTQPYSFEGRRTGETRNERPERGSTSAQCAPFAIATASRREWAPVARSTRRMWLRTVSWLRCSSSAI